MITARRIVVAILLMICSNAAGPAAASLTMDEGPDQILIADASPALRVHLVGGGFSLESVEHLEALGLFLTIAAPPRNVTAAAALQSLQKKFPAAIIALNDPFRLAHGARFRHGQTAQARKVLNAMGWQSDQAEPGAGTMVGVIDSSIDAAHPALEGAAIAQRHFTSGKPPTTDTAHGTAIAAMLVGTSQGRSISGLLRGATLFHASIFQQSRQGPKASSADFLRAVNWMLLSGVTIINASITSTSRNPVVLYAMSMLSHRRAIIVAAAGNRGPSGLAVYPAAMASAFAVTAVSVDGEAYPHANTGDYIDISAPGMDLPTISPQVTSGTSVAVPFVTAAVARMVQVCGVSPKAAQRRLQANARDLGPRGWDSHFGWGLLQAPRCDLRAAQLTAKDNTPPNN